MKQKAIVKVYKFRDLLPLVIKDLRRRTGVTVPRQNVHWVSGLDGNNDPFIRVDITPNLSLDRKPKS